MRSQRHLHIWLPALLAALGLPGASPAQAESGATEASRRPGIERREIPPVSDPTERPAHAEGPGLAEATGAALETMLDAAGRDGASWARQFQTTANAIAIDARSAWQGLRLDPVATLDGWLRRAGLPDARMLALPAAGALAVLLLLLELWRGRGDLRVSIEYPGELRGTFSVRIARKPNAGRKGPRTTSPASAERTRRRAGTSSRTERHLVSREVDFHGVRSGLWHVTVDGFLQPRNEDAVVATHFEEQEAHVRRGRTLRLDVDLRPEQAPVDARQHEEPSHADAGRTIEAARVALENGEPDRAIRSLQSLMPDDDDYVAAANLLVEVLQREGHLDLAVEKTEEIIRNRGADKVPLDTCDRLATLLEENEQFERAIDVLEIVRRRDATWPNLAARIEELRKKHQLRQRETQPTGTAAGGIRYEILEEIGRGGMGIVFKARDRRLDRVVALKKLPENLRNHPKVVDLFLREARASAQLNHPNIVTIHDTGQQGNTLYITMELMEGFPLHAILKHRGSLSPRDVAKLGLQACAGLGYAHEHHVIHRDIKTGNFFFTKSRMLKIMDFGLANMAREVRRSSTAVGGTPYYMAPEQSLGGGVDHRTDLYALGVTFYELLVGKVPFPDGDVAHHHRHTPAPDPRDAKEGIPEALAELVQQLMAKNPDERPQSAAETGERLQQLLLAAAS